MISSTLKEVLEKELSDVLRSKLTIEQFFPLGGGDINEAYRLQTNEGPFFMKFNSASRYPGMFEKEAKGLKLLTATKEIKVPEVILSGQSKDDIFLVLEYIEPTPKKHFFWKDFGRSLARMHRHSSKKFGLDHNNYMGAIPQSNRHHNTWPEFFAMERLEPMVHMARDNGYFSRNTVSAFERLFMRLGQIFPEEPPALIHGDLWTGNHMVDREGNACIIDPAVHYGHREMDIAMSRLFGSFAAEFYEAYHTEYPLENGWIERVDVCNLYPLLVHVNLFGEGYVGSVERIVRRF
jgi:fructosamine-3-kinase